MKGGESRLDTVGPKGLPSAPGSTVPVDRKAADGAPCGDTCLSQRHVNAARRWTAGCAARRSIPLPLQGTEDGPPRGPGKEYGWRSVGCLTIESGNRERKNARAPHSAHSRASGNPALGPRWSLHSGRRSRTRVRGRAEEAASWFETRRFAALLTMRREVWQCTTLPRLFPSLPGATGKTVRQCQ